MSLPDLSDPFRFGSTDRDRMPRLNEDLTGTKWRRKKGKTTCFPPNAKKSIKSFLRSQSRSDTGVENGQI
jgi:hypothetical protein